MQPVPTTFEPDTSVIDRQPRGWFLVGKFESQWRIGFVHPALVTPFPTLVD
jgi:hypothetical protein